MTIRSAVFTFWLLLAGDHRTYENRPLFVWFAVFCLGVFMPQVSRRHLSHAMTKPATASDFYFSLRRGQERNLRCDGNADAAIGGGDSPRLQCVCTVLFGLLFYH